MLDHIKMPKTTTSNNQPVQLNLSFSFTTNNRIFFPNGKHKDLHNHTYHFTICIQSPVNAYGIGMDFYKIEQQYKTKLAPTLNHPILNDVLPFNTSVENIAAFIFNQFTQYVDVDCVVQSITLYETKTHSVTINKQNGYSFEESNLT